MCDYLDEETFEGYYFWPSECGKSSNLCKTLHEYSDNGTGKVETCENGVCQQIYYDMGWTGGQQYHVNSCFITESEPRYYCAPGYSGSAHSFTNCNCCTDWITATRTTGGVGYKYRTCNKNGTVEHQYKCNEDRKYHGTIGNISCTWNDSTGTPTQNTCTGCTLCDTNNTYQDTNTAGYTQVRSNIFSTLQHAEYGTVGQCVQSLAHNYVCAPNYYGVAESNATGITPATDFWGCTKCPTITSLGLTNVPGTSITNPYPFISYDATSVSPTAFGSAPGNNNTKTINDCFVNSGSNLDVGSNYITKYQDATGEFYWTDDDTSYNCYWTN